MKIIDQTPLLDANGQLGLINRIQGMLKYGLSWPASLDAQQKVIVQLNKAIEKGYTLFRNQELGVSGIIIPLIMVGPSGLYVIEATPLKGFYRARGDDWGTIVNERFQPASINILSRTSRMAKILQVFFERQGIKLSAPVEPVLLAADPGMHIESVRPAVRVVMSDAIERFAATLLTGRPVYNTQQVGEFVEHIQNPRSVRQQSIPEPELQDNPFAVKDESPFPGMEASRMQAILNSPHSDTLIETGQSEIDFALEEGPSTSQPTVLISNPLIPQTDDFQKTTTPAPRRILGMALPQITLLAFMFLVELCVLIGFAALIYFNR